MSSPTSSNSDVDVTAIALTITKRQNQRCIGAAVHRRLHRGGMEDPVQYSIELFDFFDNEQFSAVDTFLLQMGSCILYISEDLEELNRGDGKKLNSLCESRDIERVYVKKSIFMKKSEIANTISKLCGRQTHVTNVAETERPLGYSCIECLSHSLRLLDDDDILGKYDLRLGSLDKYMKLDSAAAEAINLLPKSDHPSQFGSVFGVLNRCKTKIGSRLLERWLRQPLVDSVEINARLDTVEILKFSTVYRNRLCDGPLKNIPDLDSIVAKMQKKTAGLNEVFNLYLFTRALPGLISVVSELLETSRIKAEDDSESAEGDAESSPCQGGLSGDRLKEVTSTLLNKFISPLEALASQFALYQQLIEHVIDLDKLPDVVIDPQHDPELQELRTEQLALEAKAEKLVREARNGWASFAKVELEISPQRGLIFRSTSGDDERQLRANNSSVRIISIKKNGLHFTTPELERIADRYRDIDEEYKMQQSGLVGKAVDTATTYLPVAEAAAAIVAELDVLTAFATAAALAPGEYVRPVVHPAGAGIIHLQGARHPCVELMDGVDFISNDYDMRRGQSSFQIITGPNMGGKSTFIRGIGSIVVMAQVGSFVPCESAEISAVDCVLARVGAGDAVQKGVSTFMAEMLEASVILETATKNSLIIIDELGRGTSTFDGFGIAWAISEFIVTRTDCLCLFATHFHELTAIAAQHKGVVNKHVSAYVNTKDRERQVVMLYKVQEGPCTQSFGIHVATMAKFPKEVIAEAKRKAKELECAGSEDSASSEQGKEKQKCVAESMRQFAGMTEGSFAAAATADTLRSGLKSLFPVPLSIAV